MVEYDTPMKGQRYIQECKEQIQEDIITSLNGYFSRFKLKLNGEKYVHWMPLADNLCQIVEDNFKTLEK
jgi:hypothetical protein